MAFKSDIEIAREANKKPIQEIGSKLGIPSEHLLPYGHDKAKVSQDFINSVQGNANGKLILVTAINPTNMIGMVMPKNSAIRSSRPRLYLK